MKPGLQRIEATLDQLGTHAEAPPTGEIQAIAEGELARGIENRGIENRDSVIPSGIATAKANAASKAARKQAIPPQQGKPMTIKPFPLPKPGADSAALAAAPVASVETAAAEVAAAPLVEMNATSSPTAGMPPSRPAANPNLAVGLLKEVETIVRGWQRELEQVVQQIQALYQDGPIVDGWLESHAIHSAQTMAPGVSVLRHAEIEHLMEYVEQICMVGQSHPTDGSLRTDYRLCGLDADGKLWSRPCPTEQVPYVSLAIARYQKLRTLLEKKQSLETRLTNLVETLTVLHGQMRS